MEIITVKDLKEILNKYDDDLILVSHDEGKDHWHPIQTSDIKVKDDVYFPFFVNEIEKLIENKKFLQIGSH